MGKHLIERAGRCLWASYFEGQKEIAFFSRAIGGEVGDLNLGFRRHDQRSDAHIAAKEAEVNTQQIESIWFKKVPDGYVFRAPKRWLFGGTDQYLVTEAQKAEIVQILARVQVNRPVTMGLILGAVLVIVVMAWAYFGFHDREPKITDYLLLAGGVLASIFALLQVFAWVQRYRLSPILAQLPRSSERISFGEMKAAMQKNRSLKDSILIGSSQAFLFAVALLNIGLNVGQTIAKGHAPFNLYAFSFVAILSGWGAFTYLRRALRKAEEIENKPEPQ